MIDNYSFICISEKILRNLKETFVNPWLSYCYKYIYIYIICLTLHIVLLTLNIFFPDQVNRKLELPCMQDQLGKAMDAVLKNQLERQLRFSKCNETHDEVPFFR